MRLIVSYVCTIIGRMTVTPTGPELCAALAAFEPAEVGDDQLLSLLAAQTRQAGYQQVPLSAVLAQLGRRPPTLIAHLPRSARAPTGARAPPPARPAAAGARTAAWPETAKRAGAHPRIDLLRAEVFLGLLDGRSHRMTEAAIITALVQQYPPATDP